jgi:hypothetical protein
MTECRKVQELTKEFLKKLLKVKQFKEMVISSKGTNHNFESRRIRSKNISNVFSNDTNIISPFLLSDEIKVKPKKTLTKKMKPLMTPLIIPNDNTKEKEYIKSNMKMSPKKLPKIEKTKTSEKFKEKEKINCKIKKFEEKKNDNQGNDSSELQKKFRSKEEPIKKIKIISKIEDDLYERLLNRHKIKRISSSESPKIRANSFENNITLEKKTSLELDDSEKKKKKIKKKKFLLPSLVKEIKLQYCVYPGNNSKLIDILMEQRSDKWVKTSIDLVKFCDFIWSPLPSVIDFKYSSEKKQFVNHIEFCSNLSNKLNLYYNLFRHCESKKLNLFDYFPFTICLSLAQNNFKNQIESFKQFCQELPDYTPKSEVKYVEKFSILGSKRTGENQTINIPSTYNSGNNMWIIKPINLNRGRCIQVMNDTDAIVDYLLKIQEIKKLESDNNDNFKCEHILLQKYLEKPLLYQGRKFDIRIWIMLISGQENFVYIFKQGHLKATCAQYDINSSSPFIHLTNYSVQKHNVDFSKIEIGNEISYEEFQEELDKQNSGKNFFKDIYPKIVYIIRLAVGAVKSNINYLNRANCFEIFGCDLILDQKFKPYLLEINLNPGLEISSPLISKLVPRMVDDALKLTIDSKYYKNREDNSKYSVDGYDDGENMWEKFSVI